MQAKHFLSRTSNSRRIVPVAFIIIYIIINEITRRA